MITDTLRSGEWEALISHFPEASSAEVGDGTFVITVTAGITTPGWSANETTVSFVVPIGFPGAQPDCFWAAHDLRLASGAMPSNSGLQDIPGLARPGLWFSWHLQSWRPAADNVTTYVRFCIRRFADAR